MATLTVYPDPHTEVDTVDGYVLQIYTSESGVSWATIRADAGSIAYDEDAAERVVTIGADSVSNKWTKLRRGIFLFRTDSLGSGASISAAVMSLFGYQKSDYLAISPDIDIYTSTPASNTALVAGDFTQIGSTSQTGSPITYAGYSVIGYNDFTFNATGRGNVSKTGISKFGCRNANYDVSGSIPTWSDSNISSFYIYFAETEGTIQDPKLVVTYTLGDTGAFFQLF